MTITRPVLAVTRWSTNATMIADVHRLGYLRDEDHVLDPTYGRGIWWKKWRPARLTTHDLILDGVDFRELPEPDGYFDAVAFDPPYVSVGGRETTGMPDFHAQYGLTHAPKTPRGVQELIFDGLREMHRVVKPRGFVLVKCQSYISSGKLWPGTFLTRNYAVDVLGFELFDHLVRVQPNPRPQPSSNRTQVHARRNQSDLLVLRKGTSQPTGRAIG